ncbi:splicing factor U2AF 65 kDa subunit, putative [Perkinsus marinus ATCC 50983]|uniref:Splicing factor U2AF 65 kDa subunit, putative n=1 Tax=Perkinsus marinus (strain ATCC 50983 / TXsc) TaxID=423536 RepID=C5LY46_PERM5|nr:splicing factor U2AF 65 kDa subunit, putative [Perkinsus marinus ATCC 50983]EEQ98376.1 splicing factor U2AF 65 kDa subunit, putative [Perkinsus marinus ATCC 50983]|eukprot:XP_002765659.1 splicing factor U2AF 65 kDa subunit, putative [Perkinsus marinus ATCC 50983]
MAPPGWDQPEPFPPANGTAPPGRGYDSIEPPSIPADLRSRDHGRRERSRRRRGGSDTSSSSRSRSHGRRDKRRSRRDRSRSERRKSRKSGWDDSTEPSGQPQSNFSSSALGGAGLDASTLLMQQQVLAGGAGQNKKAKELYVGNLAKGQANVANVKEFFNTALTALPEYQHKYAHILPAGCIREVRLSPCGQYCFVEFASEEICLTALEFDRVEFLGRQLRIARPTGYTPLGPPPAPMDVSVLRVQGFLPQKAMPANPQQDKRQREAYVGNLALGVITPQVLKDLFEPACSVLPDYNSALGPPVLAADVRGEGRFAFVEFQNDRLCSAAIDIFNGMENIKKKLERQL